MIELRRREGESLESFLRRFSQKVQSSGKLRLAKAKRFRRKEPNKTAIRKSAAHRAKMRTYIEYLKKIGKFDEEELERKKR